MRVTFRFGRDTEVQYLPRAPDVGDLVTRGRELWVVTDVDTDAAGAVVICEPSNRGGGRVDAAVERLARRR